MCNKFQFYMLDKVVNFNSVLSSVPIKSELF